MAVNEQKGETEPDNNRIDPSPAKESKDADKKAYKRADIASPYDLQDSVQGGYEAAMKRAYKRAATGRDDEKGKVGSGT